MAIDKLTLNMVVSSAMTAMEFYEKVFDGVRGDVFHFPDRMGVDEANIMVGGLDLRLMDENKDYDCYPPKKGEPDSIWLQLEVGNLDATLEKAKANGADIIQEPAEFMGVKHAIIMDPFGYTWTINQVIREISFEEQYRFYEQHHVEMDNKKEE